MGIWTILAVLVVVAFLIKGGHHVYHKQKAKRDKFKQQKPTP